ncbi:hypothetical protein [Candidatus Nitrosotenuis aquarius]|uniref:hypothetical protein n=1 Tax=Candidatus Nitrosotenuis aquarius TaxID=1846278 RepID=UPI000C1F2000|nr:hypothetical protein [Candidatus Nitrosotenuis aquarius]
MNYEQLIIKWHNKAQNENDDFSRFVFEYLSFIAQVKTKFFPSTEMDRNAIQKLKQYQTLKTTYLQDIQQNSDLRNSWKRIQEELTEKPLTNETGESSEIKWWNCKYDQLDNQTEKDTRKQKGIIHSLDDWENMVEFWYSVRNNLFHAYKDPEDDRDQFLVKYGYLTLSKLMSIILNGELSYSETRT